MLIGCVAYRTGREHADIPTEDIDLWADMPGCFVWVAPRDAIDDELRQIQQGFDLHESAVEDASDGHQRPKMEASETTKRLASCSRGSSSRSGSRHERR